MTSFRTPLAKVLARISVVWIACFIFFYFLTLSTPNTSRYASDSPSLSGFIFLFSICGSPAWVLLLIARSLEKADIKKSQKTVNVLQNNSMYAEQGKEINGKSVEEYLRLQTAKNIHPDFEDIALIPEMTADDAVLDKTRSKAGQVYLIQSDRGYYKIGMTKNIDDRMATFHVKLPFEPDLIHVIECEDRRAMEKSLHIKFAAKRINGEWFDLTGTDVAFIKSIKKA